MKHLVVFGRSPGVASAEVIGVANDILRRSGVPAWADTFETPDGISSTWLAHSQPPVTNEAVQKAAISVLKGAGRWPLTTENEV